MQGLLKWWTRSDIYRKGGACMSEYAVRVSERLSTVVYVDATDAEEAVKQATEDYINGYIDVDEVTGVSVKVVSHDNDDDEEED